jgi:hypothetical protein
MPIRQMAQVAGQSKIELITPWQIGVDRFFQGVQGRVCRRLEQGQATMLFVNKVLVKGALGYPRLAHNVRHRYIGISPVGDQLRHRLEQSGFVVFSGTQIGVCG